jgi:hypothetical protein
MPDGALRVLHGATLDVETEAGFLAPGQMLVLRMVLCARGRNDVIDALNADTGERFRVRHGLRPARPFRMRFPPRRALPRWQVLRPSPPMPSQQLICRGWKAGRRWTRRTVPTPVERIRPGTTVLADDGESMSCAGSTRAIACASGARRR